MKFPSTKYMGSKQNLLPFIIENLKDLRFETVLDAFSGSGCVAYSLKGMGCKVYANDFLNFAYHTAKATTENNGTRLTKNNIDFLLQTNQNGHYFVRKNFTDLYFDYADCRFLDYLWGNISRLKSPMKQSLALAAASRACMKKRPRGIFTFTGRKGWDGRKDLQLTMKEQFLQAVDQFNDAVFSNKKSNKAFCCDVFDLDPKGIDLVYLDPPYISQYSDCDYTRRYHFVEGYCQYWQDVEIMQSTKTKKIRSYKTDFSTKQKAIEAFRRVFNHFKKSILVVSYSSNGIPARKEMINLLKEVKSKVTVREIAHKYSHGNHNHKINDNNNSVSEYLFVGA